MLTESRFLIRDDSLVLGGQISPSSATGLPLLDFSAPSVPGQSCDQELMLEFGDAFLVLPMESFAK